MRGSKLIQAPGSQLLGAVTAGFAVGAVCHGNEGAWVEPSMSVLELVGSLWTNALSMVVLPLLVSMLVVSVAASRNSRQLGRLGLLSVTVFALLILSAAGLTIMLVPPFVEGVRLAPDELIQLQAGVSEHAAQLAGNANHTEFDLKSVGALIPTNPFRAFAEGQIVQIIVCTLIFALALTRVPAAAAKSLVQFFESVVAVSMVLVGWLIRVMPLAVFALLATLTARLGLSLLSSLVYYVVLSCSIFIVFTAAMYPIAAWGGGVSLRDFARSVLPAQAVAIGTRSSLASLPALMQGATEQLRLPRRVSGFVLPLAASTFKISMGVAPALNFMVLTTLFDIPVSGGDIVAFTMIMVGLSFATPGVPGGAFLAKIPLFLAKIPLFLAKIPLFLAKIPLFLAVGIPIEGVLILFAVVAIPDMFLTLLNVTADMTAASVVNRLSRALGSNGLEAETDAVGSTPVAVE